MVIHSTTLDTMEKVIEIYGGTMWEQIKDIFLLAAGDTYKVGSVGGEATHKLTVDEMPNHAHTVSSLHWTAPLASSGGATNADSGTRTATTSSAGRGDAHNNMPPYLTVYIWKRTA